MVLTGFGDHCGTDPGRVTTSRLSPENVKLPSSKQMCGRFTLRRADKLKFDSVNAYDFWRSPARYNIAPTQPIWTVLDREGDRELTQLQWGLIPSWSEKPAGIINARAESIDEKASFKESFRRRRCLIPADGFYEWEKLGKAMEIWIELLK